MAELGILEFGTDIGEAEAPLPLPVGEYPATVEGVELRTSNTTGREYMSISMHVTPDDFPADYDPTLYPDGVDLSYNRLLTEDTPRNRYNIKKWCEAIGAPMGKSIDPSEWIGMSCKIGISHRAWEGEDRANINKVSPLVM